MPELSGPVQSIEWARWLWLILFFPLLGAAYNALFCSGLFVQVAHSVSVWLGDDDKPKPKRPPRRVSSNKTIARITVWSLVLSLGATGYHLALLLDLAPAQRFLFDHVWQLVRVGQLDVGFDLALDPLSLVMALVILAMTTLITLYAVTFMAKDPGYWRFCSWVGLFAFATLLIVMADNFVLLFLGWELASLVAFGLIGLSLDGASSGRTVGTAVGAGIKTFLLQRAGSVGILLGVALLFWGFGGRWIDGQYQPDLDPRVSPVSVTDGDRPLLPDDPSLRGGQGTKGRGFLTVTALPGALVYLDESRTPMLAADGLPIHTPFSRYPLGGGVHSFRIAPDDAFHATESGPHPAFAVQVGVLPNYLVQHVSMGADHEVSLSVLGPTLVFREMRDELSLLDPKAAHPVRASLATRRAWGGVGVITLSCLLLFFGACGKSAQLPLHGWLADGAVAPAPAFALQAAICLTVGVYLVARLGFLFSLSETASSVVVVVGAATALVAALVGLRHYDLRKLVGYACLSQVGLMFVAVGAGAFASASFQVVTYALSAGCLLLATGLVVRARSVAEPEAASLADVRHMGHVGGEMPRTAWTYMIGCIALTMAPVPLLGGFWSTNDALGRVFAAALVPSPVTKLGLVVALASSALTSFYLWRSFYLALGLASRAGGVRKKKAGREAEPSQLSVLMVLGVLAVAAGVVLGLSPRVLGAEGAPLLESWLAPAFSTVAARFDAVSPVVRYGLTGLSFACAYGGWAVARRQHGAGTPLRLSPRWVATLSIGLAILLGGEQALAQGPGAGPRRFPRTPSTPPPSAAGPGKIRVSLENGDRGPLLLASQNGGYVGHFLVSNDGPGPLTISRVAMRGDDDDPRLPLRFTARFADGGGTSTVIAPHASKRVSITWVPERDPKLRQALGHVVLTSNDETAGEVAFGFVAPMSSPLGFVTDHLLSLLIFLPFLASIVAIAMQIVGYEAARSRHLPLALAVAECLLAIVLYQGFHGVVTRADGNDGFQFVERSIWVRSLGMEYFVGVDGTSISMVLVTAIVAFVAAVASYRVEEHLPRYGALFGLVIGAMMGVFVALDLFLLYAFWALAVIAIYLLVKGWGGVARGAAANRFAAYAGAGSLLILFAFFALAGHSDPNFLVDGTKVEHTSAIPELMRVSYNAKHLELFGLSWVKVVWVALFVGFAVLVPVVPFHGWFAGAVAESSTPVTVVIAGAGLNLGVYGMLRVCLGVLPDATRWAATTIVMLGVLSVLYGAVRGLFEEDLKRLLAYASVSQMGFCLVGIGALTREGTAGCLIQTLSHGLIASMLFVLAAGLEERAKTRDIGRFGGIVTDAPLYTSLAGFAFVASLGLPGLSGFWGEGLSILGAFPLHRTATALLAVGLVVTAGYHLRTFQRLFLGPLADSLRKDPALAPFGGKFPEVSQRDAAALLPLIVLCTCLGCYPSPLLTLIQGGVSDENQLVNPPGPEELATLGEGALRAQAAVQAPRRVVRAHRALRRQLSGRPRT